MYNFDNFDVNMDTDVLAMESELSMIDFALESAQFEIEMGHDEYKPVYEAGLLKKKEANQGLIKTFINKASQVIDAIIKAVRNAMTRITNFITGKKAEKANKKLNTAAKVGIGVAGGAVVVGGLLAAIAHGKRIPIANEWQDTLRSNVASADMSEKEITKTAKQYASKEKLSIKDLRNAGTYLMNDLKECTGFLKKLTGVPGAAAGKLRDLLSKRIKENKTASDQLNDAADKVESGSTSSETAGETTGGAEA